MRISALERDPEYIQKINAAAERLHQNEPWAIEFHRKCVELSEREYRKQYKLFNVEFDFWERESNQRYELQTYITSFLFIYFYRDCGKLLDQFQKLNLLETVNQWQVAQVRNRRLQNLAHY